MAGAGTMGAGIAALAVEASLQTLLYDPDAEALERAPHGTTPVRDVTRLAECGLVIEAAPEDLELKRALFLALAEVVQPDCVLATNTSSLSVTALAAGVPNPERVVGMHFFNPPARMRLVELVAGAESGVDALAVAREAGEAMGKHVIDAADGPGFIVNRCNRPFALEALRLVQEGIATPEQVDRDLPHGRRLPDGPVRADGPRRARRRPRVSRSFYEQSFGEPRWRPSPLAARLVAAGRLGRKSGRGWYEYPPGRPPDPEPPAPGGGLVDAGGSAATSCARPPRCAPGRPRERRRSSCRRDRDAARERSAASRILACDGAALAALDPAASQPASTCSRRSAGSSSSRPSPPRRRRRWRRPSCSSARSACTPSWSATRPGSCSAGSSRSSSTRPASRSARALVRALTSTRG